MKAHRRAIRDLRTGRLKGYAVRVSNRRGVEDWRVQRSRNAEPNKKRYRNVVEVRKALGAY